MRTGREAFSLLNCFQMEKFFLIQYSSLRSLQWLTRNYGFKQLNHKSWNFVKYDNVSYFFIIEFLCTVLVTGIILAITSEWHIVVLTFVSTGGVEHDFMYIIRLVIIVLGRRYSDDIYSSYGMLSSFVWNTTIVQRLLRKWFLFHISVVRKITMVSSRNVWNVS